MQQLLIILALGFCLVILVNVLDSFNEKFLDKRTVYFKFCSDLEHNAYSCPKDSQINTIKSSYRVSFEKQIVVIYSLGATKYDDCNVLDANNWSCDTGHSFITVIDGSYIESLKDNLLPTIDEDGKPSGIPVAVDITKFEYLIRNSIAIFRVLLP